MKKIFKDKKTIITGSVVLLLVVATIITAVCVGGGSDKKGTPDVTDDETTASTVDVPDVKGETSDTESSTENGTNSDGEIIPSGTGLTPNESESNVTTAETKVTDKTTNEPTTAAPVVEQSVPTESEAPVGGVQIGDGGTSPAYNCGVANHHCANEYAHATLVNLELEGCPTCGSHSCPSFYALDEWGYTLYTPSECPNYDIHGDPVHYCQTCNKKTGNGKNGTCVSFVLDTNCPECGEFVAASTCHSCK